VGWGGNEEISVDDAHHKTYSTERHTSETGQSSNAFDPPSLERCFGQQKTHHLKFGLKLYFRKPYEFKLRRTRL